MRYLGHIRKRWLSRRLRCVLGLAALAVSAPTIARSQQPTTAEAKVLLQTRGDLVEQLKTKLLASGLSAEQVRARLKSLGYPENLLDPYIPGAVADTSANRAQPPDSVFKALSALGLGDVTRPGTTQVAKPAEVTPRRDSVVVARLDSAARAVKPTLRLFGMDVFQRTTNVFDPTEAGSADANYRIGPRDQMVLILTGDVEAAYPLEVTREGFVVVPRVGQIYVANLTLGQVTDVFFSRLQRVYESIGRGPDARIRMSVSMARLRTNQIFVLGDAVAPASYQVSGLGTVMTALYAAGGPSRNGSMRDIQVRRGSNIVGRVDLYEYLLQGSAARDVRLENGDIVFVPFHGRRVALTGAIGREAVYEIRENETLADLLRFSGGLTAVAARDRVQISRVLPPSQRSAAGRERTLIDVPLTNGMAPAFALADEDSVFVFTISDRVRNRISVAGSVWTPGAQGFTPGLHLSAALRAAGGVRPDAYLGDILVSRRMPDETLVQLRTTLLDRQGTVANDLVLQEDDAVQVFSAADFRFTRSVSIAGPLRKSGEFDFHQGMTLRDVILLAGNFPDSTDVYQDVLISRIQPDLTHVLLRENVRDAQGHLSTVALAAGDSITTFSLSQFRTAHTVGAFGMVRKPGLYAYREGMTLRDLVQLAGGLQEGAYLGRAEIARQPLTRDARELADTLSVPLDSTYIFDLSDGGIGGRGSLRPTRRGSDILLRPLDNALILRQPNFDAPRTVTLSGEVRFPGVYTLQRKGERLSEVLTRAGGLTSDAYAGGAQFVRKDDQIGRIDVEIERALRNVGSVDDYEMVNGDALYIPPYIPTIKIVGAVNSQTAVAYRPGKDIRYYIDAAGGATQVGDEERSYVLQPNGKIESYRSHRFRPDEIPEPRPGATVTVPTKEKKDTDYSTIATSVAQVASGLLTLLVVLLRK